jgi:hypothetical protein
MVIEQYYNSKTNYLDARSKLLVSMFNIINKSFKLNINNMFNILNNISTDSILLIKHLIYPSFK